MKCTLEDADGPLEADCKTPIAGSIPAVASKFSDTKTARMGRFLVGRDSKTLAESAR